jgi:hypothetical protein
MPSSNKNKSAEEQKDEPLIQSCTWSEETGKITLKLRDIGEKEFDRLYEMSRYLSQELDMSVVDINELLDKHFVKKA